MSVVTTLLLGVSPAAGAGSCPATVVAASVGPLPPAWRSALDQLVVATSRPGQPWSCGGATLTLEIRSDGGLLRVEDRTGRRVERPVDTPEDLVATGEALLAVPAPVAAPAPPPAPETRPAEEAPAPPQPPLESPRSAALEPRFLLEADVQVRFAGPTEALWVGPSIRGVIPFGAWSVSPWLRFDLPAWQADTLPDTFDMSESCLGLALGRRLTTGALQLDAALSPSVALVAMELGEEPALAEGSKADLRLGLELRASHTLNGSLRGVLGFDAELAPSAGAANRRIDPALPVLPSYTVGVSVGLQAVVP